MNNYVLGIDLGTSSLKGLLISKDGKVVATSSSDYCVIHPKAGFSEQDPQEWINAAKNVIKQILTKVPSAKTNIEAISFSGQMHSLVLLDKNDKPVRNAILWNDVRTTKECLYITEKLGKDLIKITKNRALEGFTLPKILWVMLNEPNVWKKVCCFLLPKDYLGFWFTGNKQMEFSDAAGTLLLDIEKKIWSSRIAKTFDISKNLYPKLVNSTDKIGIIKKEIAKELGIENEIPLYAGGADNACAAVGSGITLENVGLCSIGTSGVFLSYESSTIKDYGGRLHFFNHVVKDCYYSMGVTLSAGNSLNWFKKTFADNLSFEELLKGIDDIAIGSDNLLFTPYLVGERTPYADSQIRGSFIGMDVNHTISHFTRAVVEGITFSLKDSMEIMQKDAGKKFERIVSVGGGAQNKNWLQIQADIFNSTITTLTIEQGPSLGAAMIAAVGVGWYKDFKSCADKFVSFGDVFQPNQKRAEKYKDVYELYKQVYPSTRGICKNKIG
ncbi:MAG: xylulokinase [Endomicrobium sp.]|nr:xylulokinase [Endomicrobium sp.]